MIRGREPEIRGWESVVGDPGQEEMTDGRFQEENGSRPNGSMDVKLGSAASIDPRQEDASGQG